MRLRVLTNQLLRDQVIGRGLWCVAHDMDEQGLLLPEYVNIFGVPLSIFQEISVDGKIVLRLLKPGVRIEVETDHNHHQSI